MPPRISSGSQWTNWGEGGSEPHDPERAGRGRGLEPRRRLGGRRNAAVGARAASNQRCGGCAARPSIFHTKGRPPPPLEALRASPPMTAGQCRGAEKRDRHTDADRKAQ